MAASVSSSSNPGNIAGGKSHAQQPGGAYCILTRIKDSTYIRLQKRSYPLTEQYPFKCYYGHAPEDTLDLARYYTGLRCLFGKPGNLFDDWKGSFAFAFKVDVFKKEHVYTYLLKIMHYRGGIEFHFRKIVENPESHDPWDLYVYHAPLEDEFSGKDMVEVECFMYGYLQGYLRVLQRNALLNVPDFVLLSESNQIISGYTDGEFFERQSEDSDDFEAEKNLFHDLIHNPVEKWPGDTKSPTILTIEL